MAYPNCLEELIQRLEKLPGIGRRSAQRLAIHILKRPIEEAKKLSESIIALKEKIRLCKLCNNISETDICLICNNPQRQKDTICVVEDPKDVLAIEQSGHFHGLYFVLGGRISPLEGITPQNLKISPFIERVQKDQIKEVILATNCDSEGEMTAIFLTKQLKPLGVKITRIGQGIPVGGNIEYTDSATLMRAMESRTEI